MTLVLGSGTTLMLGGARSGKSRLAEQLVEESGRDPVYIATATAGDGEMADRIAEHRQRRGDRWRTVEEPTDLCAALLDASAPETAVLVDCLTLWLTNLMLRDADIGLETGKLVNLLPALQGPVVLVSNEVGLGIVPENAMAREFRDHAGRIHQAVAAAAELVVFMAAGLPLTLKSLDETAGRAKSGPLEKQQT